MNSHSLDCEADRLRIYVQLFGCANFFSYFSISSHLGACHIYLALESFYQPFSLLKLSPDLLLAIGNKSTAVANPAKRLRTERSLYRGCYYFPFLGLTSLGRPYFVINAC